LQAFASRSRTRAPGRRKELKLSLELAQRTVEEARRVIADLRPTVLDDFGLATALQLETESLRAAGWEIDYRAELGAARLAARIETALFRVAQEALQNM